MRLCEETLARLPQAVTRPGYDRSAQKIGIVHFGIGAFHRAHQAWYTERAMAAGERDWAICGVTMRSASVAEQLNPQDGLYTLTERSASGEAVQVIGAVREVLVAPDQPEAVIARIASADTKIVSFTVTEKGYARASGGGLDLDLAERSFYPLLAEGLAQRMAGGDSGLTMMSCDNLADNGRVLSALMQEYVAAKRPELSRWMMRECRFPGTMIDRIVPATAPEDRERLEAVLTLRDEGAVVTEPFSQWVIEDSFAGAHPDWAKHGAQLVGNVAPYEAAKLRMLNGAHSALAYLGLERGHDYVHQAVSDPVLCDLAERLMIDEAACSLDPAPGQDLRKYADALIERFANPALQHRLAQIAMDGSQKIPQRWLQTIAWHDRNDSECPAIMAAIGAWLRHLRDSDLVDDPQGDELRGIWRRTGDDGFPRALFGSDGIFCADWTASDLQLAELSRELREGLA